MKIIIIALPLLILTGCVSAQDQLENVRNRAAYDFDCAPNNIRITLLQSGTFGADGCRQKQVYETRGTMVYKEVAAPDPVYYQPNVGVGLGYHRYYR